MIQNIFAHHTQQPVDVDEIIDVAIDVRAARDFGGANVVKNLENAGLSVKDPTKTFFTFDCNPGGCDQKYAENQHICRLFARRHNIQVFDINRGIGTHLVFEEGLMQPGYTMVSTDSHANILGAIGAFGQGMGDKDIAYAFAHGKTWFKVPPTIKLTLTGTPSPQATPKDVVLRMLQDLGANGLLGYAAELYGEYIDQLPLDGRVTIASMATEMGGISLLFPPNQQLIRYFNQFNPKLHPIYADKDAAYADEITIDINDLEPLIARPGHPEDVVPVSEVQGQPVDSGFIGSCTNGRLSDMQSAAALLHNQSIAPGRILKIVPATDNIWKHILNEGLLTTFKQSGALVGSAGCAGCAAGQIGQTGPGETAVSTGNRNFVGKQGKGDIYLASPATVAASVLAGYITTSNHIPDTPMALQKPAPQKQPVPSKTVRSKRPVQVKGTAWVIPKDNIDTDMIYHNRYLTITDINEMGQYTFDNLKGYEQFASQVSPGDIVVTGKNFGCGSSRQQAVDCFRSLGISVIIAESFGSIYERNAINSGMPILTAPGITKKITDQDMVSVDFTTGKITDHTQHTTYEGNPFSPVQLDIYKRGGLLHTWR